MGDVHVHEAHGLAADFFPGLQALANAGDGSQGLHLQININLAAAQVVDDDHIVALVGQVHGTRPATEAVTSKNKKLHSHKK